MDSVSLGRERLLAELKPLILAKSTAELHESNDSFFMRLTVRSHRRSMEMGFPVLLGDGR